MKKIFSTALIILFVLNGCHSLSGYKVDPVLKTPTFEQGIKWSPVERLNDGFMQMLQGFAEPFNQTAKSIKAHRNPISGFVPGFAKGIGWFAAREFAGVWEIVTFLFPGRPILEPIDTSWIDD